MEGKYASGFLFLTDSGYTPRCHATEHSGLVMEDHHIPMTMRSWRIISSYWGAGVFHAVDSLVGIKAQDGQIPLAAPLGASKGQNILIFGWFGFCIAVRKLPLPDGIFCAQVGHMVFS